MKLPRNAWPIADARAAGRRPKDGVIVSFVGSVDFVNPVVYAEPGQRYDWAFLLGLDVLVLVKAGQDIGHALRSIHPICHQLDVVDEQAKKGWMVGGFKPDGSPMTCRWMDQWQPLARHITWN